MAARRLPRRRRALPDLQHRGTAADAAWVREYRVGGSGAEVMLPMDEETMGIGRENLGERLDVAVRVETITRGGEPAQEEPLNELCRLDAFPHQFAGNMDLRGEHETA